MARYCLELVTHHDKMNVTDSGDAEFYDDTDNVNVFNVGMSHHGKLANHLTRPLSVLVQAVLILMCNFEVWGFCDKHFPSFFKLYID